VTLQDSKFVIVMLRRENKLEEEGNIRTEGREPADIEGKGS
jgi:hypothetical protein